MITLYKFRIEDLIYLEIGLSNEIQIQTVNRTAEPNSHTKRLNDGAS